MNVAIYLRKSRDDQEETREETLARHERMLFEYCKNRDFIIKDIYKDKKNQSHDETDFFVFYRLFYRIGMY